MANRVTTVNFSEFSDDFRFEPKFYLFRAKRKLATERFPFMPLGQLGEKIARGQSPKPYTYKKRGDGSHIFIRTADLKRNVLNFQTIVYLRDDTFRSQKSNRVEANDLLISVVGNYLGCSAVIPNDIDEGAFNDNSARVRITTDKANPYWISAFLNSKFGHELIHASVTRTGQKILSAGNVKKLEIPIISNEPFSSRLKQCVDKLQKAQSLIYQGFDLFSKYLEFPVILPQYHFSSSFSYIDNGDLWTPRYSFPLYIKAISDIKARFDTVTLGEVVNIKKGDEVGSDEYIGYVDKRRSDIPFIRTTDIVNYEPDLYPDFFVPASLYHEINQGLDTTDVLFTKDGKIGITGMITEYDKAIISSGIARIMLKNNSFKKNLTPEYIFVALSNPIIGGFQAKQRTVIASTIPHLKEERIKEFVIPILNSEKILNITNLIKEAFRLKSEAKHELSVVKEEIDDLFEL